MKILIVILIVLIAGLYLVSEVKQKIDSRTVILQGI